METIETLPLENEYLEADLIIDGALESTVRFYGIEDFDIWLAGIKWEWLAQAHNLNSTKVWEVYVITHLHSDTQDGCECAQYVTDHHPYWSSEEV